MAKASSILFFILFFNSSWAMADADFCIVSRRALNLNPLKVKYQPGHAMITLFNYSENKIQIIESPSPIGAINSDSDTIKRLLTFPIRRHVAMECHKLNTAGLTHFKKILAEEKKHLDFMTFTFHNLWKNCVNLSSHLYQKFTGQTLRIKGISGLGLVASPDELFWTLKSRAAHTKPKENISFYVDDGEVLESFIQKINSIKLNKKQKAFYHSEIKEAQETLKVLKNKRSKAIDESKQDNRRIVNLIEMIYFDIIKIR